MRKEPEFGEVVLCQTGEGVSAIDVHFKDETVWLTQKQMADLFVKDVRTINEHVKNVYREGELPVEATVRKFRIVQPEGEREVVRQVDHYNLDVIISIGYRVNSKRGTQFRIWATTVLKEHLVQGVSVNQQRLAEKGSEEIRQLMSLLTATLEGHNLISDEGKGVLDIVNRYARTWRLLLQYDEDNLPLPSPEHAGKAVLDLPELRRAIADLKNDLLAKGEATDLFGNERGHGMDGIIGAIQQTFGGQDLYPVPRRKRHISSTSSSKITPSPMVTNGSAPFSFCSFYRPTACWRLKAASTTGRWCRWPC